MIKKILKIHDDRNNAKEKSKDQINDNPKNKTFDSATDLNSPFYGKGDANLAYYTINKNNFTPNDYLNINKDVSSFAKNYERIHKILEESRNYIAARPYQKLKAKSIHNSVSRTLKEKTMKSLPGKVNTEVKEVKQEDLLPKIPNITQSSRSHSSSQSKTLNKATVFSVKKKATPITIHALFSKLRDATPIESPKHLVILFLML